MVSVETSKYPTVRVMVFSRAIEQVYLLQPGLGLSAKQMPHVKLGFATEHAAEPQWPGRYVEEL